MQRHTLFLWLSAPIFCDDVPLPAVQVLPKLEGLPALYAMKLYELHKLSDLSARSQSHLRYFAASLIADKLSAKTLAARYNFTFKELYAFSRWEQSCTTGVFEKIGWEFVFVPGDTVILGWENFSQGLDKVNRKELADVALCFPEVMDWTTQ